MAENESDDTVQRKQRISGMFSRAAPTYDRVGPRFFSYFGQSLVDFAQIKRGENVLDVATGRGAALFPAARSVGKNGHVVGTDLSETMVEETRKEIQHRDLKNVDVLQMDAECLQLPDETFDFVLCGFALFFFPQLDRALAEIWRVLKPGGFLAVSTWEKYEDERWKWFDQLVESYFPPEEEKPLNSSVQPPPPTLDTPESIEAVLKAAGFMVLESKTESFETIYKSEEEWWAAQWSHGGRVLLERIESTLGRQGLEQFRKATFKGLSERKESDGIHSHWPALLTLAKKLDN